jgi:hypothetical protein
MLIRSGSWNALLILPVVFLVNSAHADILDALKGSGVLLDQENPKNLSLKQKQICDIISGESEGTFFFTQSLRQNKTKLCIANGDGTASMMRPVVKNNKLKFNGDSEFQPIETFLRNNSELLKSPWSMLNSTQQEIFRFSQLSRYIDHSASSAPPVPCEPEKVFQATQERFHSCDKMRQKLGIKRNGSVGAGWFGKIATG